MDALFSNDLICGIDEAGRGPLAGPVVAAAVVLDSTIADDVLFDSKKLSKAQREKAFLYVLENAESVGIGYSSAFEVDFFNIRIATLMAMKRAWISSGALDCPIFIDGRDTVPGLPEYQKALIGGDAKVKAISAASIVAKVMRDWTMEIFHRAYPLYNFEKHKGYGTREHIELILRHKPCRIHRSSFLKKICSQKDDWFIADLL